MVKPGPKPGFKITKETREKMRLAKLGRKQDPQTREKISKSLSKKIKTSDHRDSISRSMLDIDRKCWMRYLELVSMYPEHEEFFEANREDILEALEDIKSEKELDDILRYYETSDAKLFNNLPYQYESSSVFAQEDAVIAVLDALRRFRKLH